MFIVLQVITIVTNTRKKNIIYEISIIDCIRVFKTLKKILKTFLEISVSSP